MKKNKFLAILLAAAMMLSLLPTTVAAADTAPSVNLGTATEDSNKLYFKEAQVSGDGIRTIFISFSGSVTSGDEIVLPSTLPSGFTVSTSSTTNKYAKRINLVEGTSSAAVEGYLRGVGFTLDGDAQSVQVVVSTENIQHDTYYNIDTKHYYQFIPYENLTIGMTTSWSAAYTAAKGMSYMGRSGYLATITSEAEDVFVNALSNGQTGWLGGTIMTSSGTKVDASGGSTGAKLYYTSFNAGSAASGWYWACGPEIGTKFYSTTGVKPDTVAAADSASNAAGYYYNWARITLNPTNAPEPNTTANPSSSFTGSEACLTTLDITGNNYKGVRGTNFSWNDLVDQSIYNGGPWSVKGYFVEYGNLPVGDDAATGSTTFASASGTLSFNAPQSIAVAVGVSSFDSSNVSSDANSRSLIQITGNASTSGGILRIVPAATNKSGAAIRRTPITLSGDPSSGGFSTYFVMNLNSGSASPADGLVFYIRDTKHGTAQGGYGAGLGYGSSGSGSAMPGKSFGVEFDLHSNSNTGDPTSYKVDPGYYHVAIVKDGDNKHDDPITTPTQFASLYGQDVHVWLDYYKSGEQGILQVQYGTSNDRSKASTISKDVGTELIGEDVYIGFSASTGGSYANHDIKKWYFQNSHTTSDLSGRNFLQGPTDVDIALTKNSDGVPTSVTATTYIGADAQNSGDVSLHIDGEYLGEVTSGVSYTFSNEFPAGTHELKAVSVLGGTSKTVSFTVPGPITGSYTNNGDGSYTLSGNVALVDGYTVGEYGFLYGVGSFETKEEFLESPPTKVKVTTGSTSSFTHTLEGLTPGTAYTFLTYSVKGGTTSYGERVTLFVPIGTPSTLTATPSTDSITLAWAAVPGAQNYLVYMDGAAEPVEIEAKETPGHIIQELDPNTPHHFKVYAKGTHGTSATAEIARYTQAADPTFTLTPGEKTVTVNIALGENPVGTKHRVYYRVNGAETWTPCPPIDVQLSYTITGLNSNTKYDVDVRAINGEDWMTVTPVIQSVTTSLAAPTVQPPTSTASGSGHSVGLSWSAVPDAVSYKIYRDGEYLHTVEAAHVSYSDNSNLKGNQQYTYTVTAVNAGGSESAAGTATVRTQAEYPSAVTVTEKTANSITLTLTPSSNLGDNAFYQIIVKDKDGTVAQTPSWSTDLTQTVTGLDPDNSPYSVIVKVRNSDGAELDASGKELLTGIYPNRAVEGDITGSGNVTITKVNPNSFDIPLKLWDPDGDTVTATATIGGVTRTVTVTGVTGEPEASNAALTWDAASLPDGTYSGITVSVSDGHDSTLSLPYSGTLIVDKTPPDAPTLSGVAIVYLTVGDSYTDAGIEGDMAGITVISNVNTYVPGTYTVTYTATDEHGNSSTVTRTVVVAEPIDSDNLSARPPEYVGKTFTVITGVVNALPSTGCYTAHGFVYYTGSAPTLPENTNETVAWDALSKKELGAKDDTVPFRVALTGLTPGTAYSVLPYVVLSDGSIVYGAPVDVSMLGDAEENKAFVLFGQASVTADEDDNEIVLSIIRLTDAAPTDSLTVYVEADDGLDTVASVVFEVNETKKVITVSSTADGSYATEPREAKIILTENGETIYDTATLFLTNTDPASGNTAIPSGGFILADIPNAITVIDNTTDPATITVAVPIGTDITDITPSFNLPEGATISPTGSQDFSVGAVIYTVTAQDGSTKEYRVTVEQKSFDNSLEKLDIGDVTLTPAFDPNVTSYTSEVSAGQSTLDLSGIKAPEGGSVSFLVNGSPVSDPSAINLGVGSNTVTITVTAESGAEKTYTILVSRSAPSGGGKGNGSAKVPVIVNGQTVNAGTQTIGTTANGRSSTTVTVDTTLVDSQLKSAGAGAQVIVPIAGDQSVKTGILTGAMVERMENQSATLQVNTGDITYIIPAGQLDINHVAADLGAGAALDKVQVSIHIESLSGSSAQFVRNAANTGGFSLVLQPVTFTITASYGGSTQEIDTFSSYVERRVEIPEDVDASKITTAVVVEPDGSVRHVPTMVTVVEGKYYAVINSLTNSTYTLIWNPVTFSDAASSWTREAIDDLGSRKVVTGVGGGNYAPERNITRAEFAAILVRALGLDTGLGDSSFPDVAAGDWYYGYVQTAVGYGIVEGYNNGNFGPEDAITREQAMTMLARAMSITRLSPELSNRDMDDLTNRFTDSADIASYARASVAACVKTGVVQGSPNGMVNPGTSITRAEVAATVQRLLQASGLTN